MSKPRYTLTDDQLATIYNLGMTGTGPALIASLLNVPPMAVAMRMLHHPHYPLMVQKASEIIVDIYTSDSNETYNSVAEKTGWSKVFVTKACKNAGVSKNPGGRRKDGEPNLFGTGASNGRKRPTPEIPRNENMTNHVLTMRWG